MVRKGSGPRNNYRKRQIYKLEVSEIPCFYCGVCCSKYQPQLNLSEAQALAGKLGISWKRFFSDYVDPRWPGTRNILLRQVNNVCIFLCLSGNNKQRLCLIQDYKPSCCLEWKPAADRPECLEGLKTNWELAIDSSGIIYGPREKIEAFESFILAQK